MKNEIFRTILKIHKRIPTIPFEKELIKIYHLFQEKNKIIDINIEGINYHLDLSEVIDNKVFYGNWEPETTAMFKRLLKQDMTFLDIGANMGYYTLLSGKIVGNKGRVIAFEPTSNGFERLETNVSLNKFKSVEIEKLGLSNKNKKIKANLRSSWKISGLVEPEKETIDMMKLDNYLAIRKIGRVDFIKIDVDGYEYEVLKGAKKTLETYKPILYLEMGHYENKIPQYTLKEVIDFVKELEYSFHYEDGRPFKSEEEIINHIPDGAVADFLLISKWNNLQRQ